MKQNTETTRDIFNGYFILPPLLKVPHTEARGPHMHQQGMDTKIGGPTQCMTPCSG